MSMLVQFVRGQHGKPRGVMVATKKGLGWSAVHPRDEFDKGIALSVAEFRAEKGTRKQPPRHFRASLDKFANRAERYFRQPYNRTTLRPEG